MLPFALQSVHTNSSSLSREEEELRLYEELVGQLWDGISGAQIESLCREKILTFIDTKL
jgi:hypothetical protein